MLLAHSFRRTSSSSTTISPTPVGHFKKTTTTTTEFLKIFSRGKGLGAVKLLSWRWMSAQFTQLLDEWLLSKSELTIKVQTLVSGQTVTRVYLSSNMHPAVTESSFSLARYLLCQHARVGLAFHSLRCCFMKQRQQISQCLHDFRGNPRVWRFYWSLRSGYSIHVLSDTSGGLGGFVHDKNAEKWL